MIRSFVTILTVFVAFVCSSATYAADTKNEVRPSHLLNVETSGTVSQDQLVLSLFGRSMRAAYGLTSSFETRIDASWNTLIDVGTSYSLAATAKYTLWSNPMFGVGILGQAGITRVNPTSAFGTFTGRLPVTLKVAPVLVTAVPFISQSTTSGAEPAWGGNLAMALPVVSFANVIGEIGFVSQNGNSDSTYAAGVVFKPANRITIPVVVANKSGATKTIGLAAIFAHVGFEL